MKISTSVALVALVEAQGYRAPRKDAEGNRITGKHPKRRLQALNKFACNWLKDNLEAGLVSGWKKNTSDKLCHRFNNWSTRMAQVFERKECAFYDPSVKFGGPDPNAEPGKRKNGKDRRIRRSTDDDEDDMTEEEMEELLADEDTVCTDEDGSTDALSAYGLCETPGVTRKSKVSPVNRKWRRVNTGYAKWCNRYVSECYGQRKFEYCVKRAANFFAQFQIQD